MPWFDGLRLWTQDLYMACLAVDHLPHSSSGLAAIRPAIRSHTQLRPNLLAPPSLQGHPNRSRASANLHNADYRRARSRFRSRLARVLLVDLYVVLDQEVQARARGAGSRNVDVGFEANVAGLGIAWQPYPWAYARCVELAAVRNCVVHNDQKWQEAQINRLKAIKDFPYSIPVNGQAIELELSHLFVYKSAVRQLLNI